VAAAVAPDLGGGLLVGDAAGTLHCLDMRTGTLRWEHPLVHEVPALIVANGGALIVAPPLVAADGTIYLGGRDGSLTALRADGAVRWRYETGSDITATPAQTANGTILVGLLDWRVLGMSPDGRLGWAIRLNGSVRSTPLHDADGTLYITTVGGRLYAIKAQSA
jgi:outer membrane protein assembly factor BamB